MNNDESKTYIISHFKKEKFEFKKIVDSKKFVISLLIVVNYLKIINIKNFFIKGKK